MELNKEDFFKTKWDQSEWTLEQKIKWQQKCFELGFSWGFTEAGDTIQNLDKVYFYLSHSTLLYDHTEVDYEDDYSTPNVWEDMFPESIHSEYETTPDVVVSSENLLTEESHVKLQDASAFRTDKPNILEEVDLFKEYSAPFLNKPTEHKTDWTDKHYDNYYTLSEEDLKEGKIRIDAYFVNRMWRLNSVDDTGAAFHSLKTFARMGNNKNTLEREINALNGQLKRWAKLNNIKLK